MKTIKKFSTITAAVTLAATLAGCTPSVGSGSVNAATIGGHDIPAGVFIYYTIQGINEASSLIEGQTGAAPDFDEIKSSNIDGIESTVWIQNKALEYCTDYAGIVNEFEAIGGKLSREDIDSANEMAEYYYSADPTLAKNGVSLDSMKAIAESTYMEQAVFKHYYDFEGEKGCSEEELKEFFDENFARIKYVSISLKDQEGNKVSPTKERELRKLADSYAEQVNKKSGELNKMHELDKVSEAYDEYVSAQTTTASGETAVVTTTTTTTVKSSETTTTDPYANERLIQKYTTTTAAAQEEAAATTTTAETDSDKNARLFNDYIFNELPYGKAEVYDFSEDTIYVVLRADLKERMTEDDYWSEDYITNIQSIKYSEEFIKYLEEKTSTLTVEKNKSAFRRYEPFKLELTE